MRLVERLGEDALRRARLGGGSGGPHDPGMEARVAALEADMRDVKDILARMEPLLRSIDERLGRLETRVGAVEVQVRKIENDFARLEGRVSQLPTTWTLLAAIVATIMTVFGSSLALPRFAGPG